MSNPPSAARTTSSVVAALILAGLSAGCDVAPAGLAAGATAGPATNARQATGPGERAFHAEGGTIAGADLDMPTLEASTVPPEARRTAPAPPSDDEPTPGSDLDRVAARAGDHLAPAGCVPPAGLGVEPLTTLASDRPFGQIAHYYELALSADGHTLYGAGIPGLVVYDVADGALERVGQYPLTMMPTDAFDAIAPLGDDHLALVNGNMHGPVFMGGLSLPARLVIMDVSEPAAPQYSAILPLPGASDVAVHGDQVFITDPQGQLLVVDVANPAQPVLIAQLASFNMPRSIVIEGTYAYIADMVMGLVVVDIAVASDPKVLKLVDTAGGPQKLSVADGVLWVSSGSAGFEAFDLSKPAAPELLGGASTGRAIAGLRAAGGLLWTSEHEVITAWDVSEPAHPRRLRSASTPGYALDVMPIEGDQVLVADWDEIQRWALDRDGLAAQLSTDGELHLPGGAASGTLPLGNVGAAALSVTGLQADVDGYEITLPQLDVGPGQTVIATVTWTGAGPPPPASLCVASNDPGASVTTVSIEPVAEEVAFGPKLGEPAPEFVLPDLNGDLHALSDYAGHPVLVILFAGWCPVCHVELPDIEATLWADYKDQGLQILAIGGYQETIASVQEFQERYDLTFPILYDEAGTVLSKYRFTIPGASGATPFPQDFMIGADQTVLWRGDVYAPQAIGKLIESQLAQ